MNDGIDTFYRGKRVLVTGDTGFKGAWLCKWLHRMGAHVTGAALPAEAGSLFARASLDRVVMHHDVDVRDRGALSDVFNAARPELLFHLAAQALVPEARHDPTGTFAVNVMGMVHVLECARSSPALRACVLITSDKVYDPQHASPQGYTENHKLGGDEPYAASKACAEHVVRAYVQTFFQSMEAPRCATTRAGNVVGGGDIAPGRLVPDCVRAWTRGDAVVLQSPSSTRPWQHVLEPLGAYLAIGRALHQRRLCNGERFNVGPNNTVGFSVGAMVEALASHWPDARWSSANAPHRASDALTLDSDALHARLGWRPLLTLEETAAMTALWYLDQTRGADPYALLDRDLTRYLQLAKKRQARWLRLDEVTS